MKPSALFLAGSLAANAILVCLLLAKPELAPPAMRPFLGHSASTEAAPRSAPRTPRATSTQKLWAMLGTDDLPTLVARLRAAGFPASIIRQIVNLELSQRYDARLRAAVESDASAPFWRMSSNIYGADSKKWEDYSAIQRERAKLQRELLSGDFFKSDDVSASQRRQFGDLPRQKIDLLQRIEDDYADMLAAVRSGMRGITLPEDRQQLEMLNKEKHADLAAILSPEELADYEMRTSPITDLLRYRFNNFTPTEAEFRAIFAEQQTLNDKLPYTNGVGLGNDYQQRQELMKTLNDQLRATIGDARYRDFMRETSSDYQTLTRLAQRENLPTDTALRAYNVRDTVDQESNRIFDDGSLSDEEKRAALQALAQNTRSQLVTLLGPTAGPAYVKLLDNQWLGQVERGTAIAFNGGGTGGMSMSNNNVIVMLGSQPTYRRVPPPPRQ